MRGLFVTGTDTGAGKTFVTAAIAARLAADGCSIAVRKPLLTGLAGPVGDAGRDDLLLAGLARCDPDRVTLHRFDPAVSPHLAAELAGVQLDVEAIASTTLESCSENEVLIVEGVGGLLVPIRRGESSVADLAAKLGLPVVIAARTGLGTISHTLLTVEAARARDLKVRSIVLGPWPADPSPVESDNLLTIRQETGIDTVALPFVSDLSLDGFAAAAAAIPASDWL